MVPFANLLAALEMIDDPRRPQGRRYSMSHLLLFSVLAVLAGATSYQSIVTFMAVHRERLNAVFGAGLRRAPAVNTLRHLFVTLDPDALETAFRHHARQLDGASVAEGRRTVALDGKTLRGSFDHLHDRTTAHVLSAFASDAALILAHREVPAAPEEIGGVQGPCCIEAARCRTGDEGVGRDIPPPSARFSAPCRSKPTRRVAIASRSSGIGFATGRSMTPGFGRAAA